MMNIITLSWPREYLSIIGVANPNLKTIKTKAYSPITPPSL
jgi:hypothetical protein